MKYFVDPSDVDIPIGEKLRLKRRELKMTQKDLASVIGVTFQQLQKYESGQSKVSIEMLMNLCKALSVNVDYFIKITSMNESNNIDLEENEDLKLEKRLVDMFRSIKSDKVKNSVLKLVDAIIATSEG